MEELYSFYDEDYIKSAHALQGILCKYLKKSSLSFDQIAIIMNTFTVMDSDLIKRRGSRREKGRSQDFKMGDMRAYQKIIFDAFLNGEIEVRRLIMDKFNLLGDLGYIFVEEDFVNLLISNKDHSNFNSVKEFLLDCLWNKFDNLAVACIHNLYKSDNLYRGEKTQLKKACALLDRVKGVAILGEKDYLKCLEERRLLSYPRKRSIQGVLRLDGLSSFSLYIGGHTIQFPIVDSSKFADIMLAIEIANAVQISDLERQKIFQLSMPLVEKKYSLVYIHFEKVIAYDLEINRFSEELSIEQALVAYYSMMYSDISTEIKNCLYKEFFRIEFQKDLSLVSLPNIEEKIEITNLFLRHKGRNYFEPWALMIAYEVAKRGRFLERVFEEITDMSVRCGYLTGGCNSALGSSQFDLYEGKMIGKCDAGHLLALLIFLRCNEENDHHLLDQILASLIIKRV